MDEPPSARRILHCDMDCFYPAVHMRDEPALAGKPVIVGGDPEARGVVASASYEARRFGIHSAMPAARARRLCPDAVFLRPDFPRYRREADAIFAIYREFTPIVETASLDEAYLDLTAHLGSFATATAVAQEIRRRVRAERGLTVSIGVGPNRLIAKIASDFRKPDGLTVVPPARVDAFLAPLAVRRLHGVGPATEAALEAMGIRTVAELRACSLEILATRFKSYGRTLCEHARGIDARPIEPIQQRRSLGTETTFRIDLAGLEAMDDQLGIMAKEVSDGLRRRGLAACTVQVKVRFPDFRTVTRSHTMAFPSQRAARLADHARDLLRRTAALSSPVRLLGLAVSTLVPASLEQLELFDLP